MKLTFYLDMYKETSIVVFLKKKERQKKHTHTTQEKKKSKTFFPPLNCIRIKGTVYIMGLISWADFVNCYFFVLFIIFLSFFHFFFSFTPDVKKRKL